MNLQRKFTVLLGLSALCVATTLGVTLGYNALLARDAVAPFEVTTRLLMALSGAKRAVGDLTRQLPGPRRDEPGRDPEAAGWLAPRAGPTHSLHPERLAAWREEYEAGVSEAAHRVEALVASEEFASRIGASSARTIRERWAEASAAAARWFESGVVSDGVRAGDLHFAMHELIERAETKVIAEGRAALRFTEQMQSSHRVIVVSGMSCAVLLLLLGAMLVRRWVVAPVEELRRAADAISRGDYAHRVKVESADELGRLSHEVNEMAALVAKTQADAIERERLASTGEMVRRLAHNLRNPLAGIRGLAELSIKRQPDNETLREEQGQIIQTVDRFNCWLRDLLSATSPLEIRPEPTGVSGWLDGVVESHGALARMRSVSLESDTRGSPETATFDPRHLEHALVAIVTNAIQASPPGGKVALRSALEPTPANGPVWTIRVSDEGPGIAPDVLSNVFRPYFTTKRDGNGIGLAIAQQVVKRHGGWIEVETSCTPPNRGTTFSVRIPHGCGT